MRHTGHTAAGGPAGPSTAVYSALIVIGLIAPAMTFMIAVSGLAPDIKVYGLAATAALYFSICFWSYKRLRADAAAGRAVHGSESPEDELSTKLLALEEANEFFGRSLQPADTFRLVCSRIRDLYDFDTGVLFLADPSGSHLNAAHAQGSAQQHFQDLKIEKGMGLAGLAILSGDVEFSHDLEQDRDVIPPAAVNGIRSAAAVPVSANGEPFGVLQLFFADSIADVKRSRDVLAAVGERIGPLLRGSIAAGESLSSALTDPMTNLPNERAFFMILENQVAESTRFRGERPLSVVAIDIKGVDDNDGGVGLVEGESVLSFIGDVIRRQLRKMDFLARSGSDEFLIILPTASQTTADEVVKRIRASFARTPFTTEKGDEVKIWLNIGRACFWQDGETANQLLQAARLRKQQAKSQDPDKIAWFPKEYVN